MIKSLILIDGDNTLTYIVGKLGPLTYECGDIEKILDFKSSKGFFEVHFGGGIIHEVYSNNVVVEKDIKQN